GQPDALRSAPAHETGLVLVAEHPLEDRESRRDPAAAEPDGRVVADAVRRLTGAQRHDEHERRRGLTMTEPGERLHGVPRSLRAWARPDHLQQRLHGCGPKPDEGL